MARRVNEEDPNDDKDPCPAPVTRRPSRRSVLLSGHAVCGFLAFAVLVLAGSLAFTIVSSTSSRAASDPDEEWRTARRSARMVNRSDWKAAPPTSVVVQPAPAQYVVIGQTATEGCPAEAQCAAAVHAIQASHLARGFSDVAYNFLVGGDGTVYEGRGWGVRCPHTHVRRRPSVGIGLVGTFTRRAPSGDQLDATRQVIRVGVEDGYITANYTLLADFDQKATDFLSERQGNKLLEELSTWPHWSTGS